LLWGSRNKTSSGRGAPILRQQDRLCVILWGCRRIDVGGKLLTNYLKVRFPPIMIMVIIIIIIIRIIIIIIIIIIITTTTTTIIIMRNSSNNATTNIVVVSPPLPPGDHLFQALEHDGRV